MPDTLRLRDTTRFEEIQDYLVQAGPQARIGVREGAERGSIELYRRDNLDLFSTLIDAFTNGFSRKENYQKAKTFIVAKAADWSQQTPQAKGVLTDILAAHNENFHSSEFISMKNQLSSQRLVNDGYAATRAEKSISRTSWNVLPWALMNASPSKIAAAICHPMASDQEKSAIARGFEEFRNFVQAKINGVKSSVSIDFVAVINFEKALTEALDEPKRKSAFEAAINSPEACKALPSLLENTLTPGRSEIESMYSKVTEKNAWRKVEEHRMRLQLEEIGAIAEWVEKGLKNSGDPDGDKRIKAGLEALLKYYKPSFHRDKKSDFDIDYKSILFLKSAVEESFSNSEKNLSAPDSIKDHVNTKIALELLLNISPKNSSNGTSIEEFI